MQAIDEKWKVYIGVVVQLCEIGERGNGLNGPIAKPHNLVYEVSIILDNRH
jgi:hypothetical protein